MLLFAWFPSGREFINQPSKAGYQMENYKQYSNFYEYTHIGNGMNGY